MERENEFITTGDVARIIGCSLDRVNYAIRGGRVREDARAGNYRLYRRDRLPELIVIVRSVGAKGQPGDRRDEVEGGGA